MKRPVENSNYETKLITNNLSGKSCRVLKVNKLGVCNSAWTHPVLCSWWQDGCATYGSCT